MDNNRIIETMRKHYFSYVLLPKGKISDSTTIVTAVKRTSISLIERTGIAHELQETVIRLWRWKYHVVE